MIVTRKRAGKFIKFLPIIILLLSFATAGYIVIRDWSSISLFTKVIEAPAITNLEPSSGAVGTEVTITGSGFTKTKNAVVLGPNDDMNGYVKNLESKNKRTIKFTIPDGLDACSPEAEDNGYPCSAAYPKVESGEYSIYITNENGESNKVTFEVTE